MVGPSEDGSLRLCLLGCEVVGVTEGAAVVGFGDSSVGRSEEVGPALGFAVVGRLLEGVALGGELSILVGLWVVGFAVGTKVVGIDVIGD